MGMVKIVFKVWRKQQRSLARPKFPAGYEPAIFPYQTLQKNFDRGSARIRETRKAVGLVQKFSARKKHYGNFPRFSARKTRKRGNAEARKSIGKDPSSNISVVSLFFGPKFIINEVNKELHFYGIFTKRAILSNYALKTAS